MYIRPCLEAYKFLIKKTFDQMSSFDMFSVRSCGLLDVPRSTKSDYGYTIGVQTTITGCRVGHLEGTSTYRCVETSNVTQEWSPAVTAVCAGKHCFSNKP